MAHIQIPGNYNHQLIAQDLGSLQIENMAGMEKVKGACGDNGCQSIFTGTDSTRILIQIIKIVLKAIVLELHIQDGKVTPLARSIVADPGTFIERRTDYDMIVSGARE
jgi:hypothetical protein